MTTNKLAKVLTTGVKAGRRLKSTDFLSTGSTLLNLALSGRPFGGLGKGSYSLSIGNSSAGKTMLALTALAEAANNERWKDYRLIYDATTEDGAQMDFAKMFGSKMANRLEFLASETAEDFYYNVDDAIKKGKPFIYICDSENGLDSDAAEAKFQEKKAGRRKGKAVAGSYGDGKPKIHSQGIRRVCAKIKKSGSMLIMLSQTRDNIGALPFQDTQTRSGGRALKFYAQLEYWLSLKENITRTVRGKSRKIGMVAQVKVKKNRYTGKERTITFDFYYSTGIDDVGANVDYLLEEGHWKKGPDGIRAKEFKFRGSRDDLIDKIERRGYEKDLALLVADVWNDIEAACTVHRKSRYS
jgi:RecA/RadA recombinase